MSAGAGEFALMLASVGSASVALAGPVRWRRYAVAAALLLAPALIAAENWDSSRFADLRDDPALLTAGLLAAAALTAGLAAAFRRWPLALPLAAVAMLPARVPVELGGDTSHLLVPLYLVIAAGVAANWAAIGSFAPTGRWRWVVGALAASLMLYGVQAAYGPGFSQAAENAGFFFIPFAVLFVLLATVEWDRRLALAAFTLVLAEGLIFTAVAAGQFAAGELWWNQKVIEGNQYHEWFRVNSLFWDPNIFGRYLAVAITLAAALIAHASSRRPLWLTAAAAAVMLAGLAASFSQSALLALLAGLAVVLAMRWSVRRTAAALLACLAIAAAALVISGTPDLSEERLEEETSGRASLIRGGLELAADRPVYGYGSGAFAPEFRQRFESADELAVSSHSEPITVAAEQGALGMLPYLALLVASAIALAGGLVSRREAPADPWVQCARVAVLAGFAVMAANSIAYAAFLTDPITWALLAAGLALARTES